MNVLVSSWLYGFIKYDIDFIKRSVLPNRGALKAWRIYPHHCLYPSSAFTSCCCCSVIGIACRASHPAFVCYASTSTKMTLSSELILWWRSTAAWRRPSGVNRTECCGLGSDTARMKVQSTDTICKRLSQIKRLRTWAQVKL
jgi:hypothetical protein